MKFVIPLENLDEGIESLKESKQKSLVLITSGTDAEGKYWCKDCEVVAPLYEEFEAQAIKFGLPFWIFVVDRPFWKDQKNKLRVSH